MKTPKLQFATLNGKARQIVTALTNSIAFQKDDCCSVDDLATQFKTTPGRLRKVIDRLKDAGLVTVKGEIILQVVPTVKLLRTQVPAMSEAEAKKLVKQYERGKYSRHS